LKAARWVAVSMNALDIGTIAATNLLLWQTGDADALIGRVDDFTEASREGAQ
jgi:hypothetical protein